MTGFIYRSPRVYEGFMRLLYGREFAWRYQAVADTLDGCESVVDVCCGPAILKRYVDERIAYTGVDCNRAFIRRAKQLGAEMVEGNVREVDIPPADAVVMVSSLYQFIPDQEQLIERMVAACVRRVVISEPVQHTSHANWLLTKVASILLDPGVPYSHHRFDHDTMAACFRKMGFQRIQEVGTRELIGVFEKS